MCQPLNGCDPASTSKRCGLFRDGLLADICNEQMSTLVGSYNIVVRPSPGGGRCARLGHVQRMVRAHLPGLEAADVFSPVLEKIRMTMIMRIDCEDRETLRVGFRIKDNHLFTFRSVGI